MPSSPSTPTTGSRSHSGSSRARGDAAMAAREHRYAASLTWTGADAGPTTSYQSYSRAWRIAFAGKPVLEGSADPTFRGDPALHNPEELLLAALATCHMLSYLALCSL